MLSSPKWLSRRMAIFLQGVAITNDDLMGNVQKFYVSFSKNKVVERELLKKQTGNAGACTAASFKCLLQ